MELMTVFGIKNPRLKGTLHLKRKEQFKFMDINPSLKCPAWGSSLSIFLIGFSSLWLIFNLNEVAAQEISLKQAKESAEAIAALDATTVVEGNSYLPLSQHPKPEDPKSKKTLLAAAIMSETSEDPKKMWVILTAYSSTVWQTDDTPFITALGTVVRDGIVANNLLPFGTEIKIPELYGDKIFVVEDRMNWRKGGYHVDIWFPEYYQALNFGVKRTYIEIL